VPGQWILLAFISLHPLHTRVGAISECFQDVGVAYNPHGYFEHSPVGFTVSLSCSLCNKLDDILTVKFSENSVKQQGTDKQVDT
jgi:hypothetical protein